MILNDICEVYSGYALKKFNENGDGLPVIKIGNILADGTLGLEDCEYTTEKVHDKYYSKKEDIYVALSGATTGKIGINKSDKKYIINQRVGIVRKKDNNIPNEFIKFFLLRQTERILQEAAGCAQPNISPKQIAQYALPDIRSEKMRQIAVVLNRLTSVIVSRKTELQKLDDLIKARFVELFGDIITNEKDWPTSTIGEISTSRLGKMLDAKKQTGKWEFPYLANQNVQWFHFDLNKLNMMDFDEADQKEFELREGDLMITEGGEVGRCAVWHDEITPCFYQKAIHRVRCNVELVLPDYLAFWFKMHADYNRFEDIVGGVTSIAHLPGVKLKRMEVVLPPISLQEKFVEFIRQVDKSKAAVQAALDETKLLFDSLMQEYFG